MAAIVVTVDPVASEIASAERSTWLMQEEERDLVEHRRRTMKRVTGIGGIFFKSADPKSLCAWYRDHLGLDVTEWGGVIFQWGGPESPPGMTIWSPFAQDTSYMEPSSAPFMINFRVADLDALLAALRAEGCNVVDKTETSEQGKFGWVIDPDGNKIELWEPPPGQ